MSVPEDDRERQIYIALEECYTALETGIPNLRQALFYLERLETLRDNDLFDGTAGRDALAELEDAMRHARNAHRIIERRAELEADEQ